MTLGITAAPLLLLGVVVGRGFAGWVGLGLFFLLLGLISPAIAAWGERTRPQPVTPAETTTELGGPDPIVANAGLDDSR